MSNLTDIDYIRSIRQGDTNSYVFLVRRYQPMVYSLVIKMVGDRTEAEDLTQEIFIKVYLSLSKFREDAKFSTWLYRIACNCTISFFRKKGETKLSLDENSELGAEYSDFEEKLEDANKEERLRCLNEALKLLPPEELWIVTLYYKEGTPVSEIAHITGLSESNVKVKLHRTRKWLKTEMEKKLKV